MSRIRSSFGTDTGTGTASETCTGPGTGPGIRSSITHTQFVGMICTAVCIFRFTYPALFEVVAPSVSFYAVDSFTDTGMGASRN